MMSLREHIKWNYFFEFLYPIEDSLYISIAKFSGEQEINNIFRGLILLIFE